MSHHCLQKFMFETTVQDLIEENVALREDRRFLAIVLALAGISNVIALLAAFKIF